MGKRKCLVCGLPIELARGRQVCATGGCKQKAWRLGLRRGMVKLPGSPSDPDDWEPGGNLAACKVTVATMRSAGMLSEKDEAVVAHALSLAQATDKQPASATLAREYREALRDLLARGAGGGDAARDIWAALMADAPA